MCFYNGLLVRKCLKVQIKNTHHLVLCKDMTLVHPLCLVPFFFILEWFIDQFQVSQKAQKNEKVCLTGHKFKDMSGGSRVLHNSVCACDEERETHHVNMMKWTLLGDTGDRLEIEKCFVYSFKIKLHISKILLTTSLFCMCVRLCSLPVPR